MTNIEFLNFRFINRKTERAYANEFLKSEKNIKILTIIGEKSVGKKFFIDEIIKENKSFTCITLDCNNIQHTSAYRLLIDELEKISNGSLVQFVKRNYKEILNISAKAVETILNITTSNANTSDLINYLYNANMFFLNSKNQQESTIKLLCKYIKEISKNENLLIAIKDISKCDDYSIPLLYQTISSSVAEKETDVKYIVSIDQNDWNQNVKEVFDFFSFKVPVFPITIKKFENYKFFLDILFDIFDFTTEDNNSIEHIFNVCNGYPGELKILMSKLYFNNANVFILQNGKVKWDTSLINSILSAKNTKIEFNNPVTELIFQIILNLEIDLSYDMLKQIVLYIGQKMHFFLFEDNDKKIEESIHDLIFSYKLVEIKNDENDYVVLANEVDRELCLMEVQYKRISKMLSRYISEFLLINRDKFLTEKDKKKYLIQLALHTYNSEYQTWEKINYQIGNYFYTANEISVAQNIFIRFQDQWKKRTKGERVIIAHCLYDAGKYDLSEKAIEDISTDICNYDELMLIVKIKNINMKKSEAIKLLDDMLKNDRFNAYSFEILDIKQRILSNIATERKNAKKLFDSLQKQFNVNPIDENNAFLISSMEYYRGNVVQDNFKILENYYKKCNNQLMLAELWVNKGFDYFWQGNILKAKEIFKDSIKKFELLRIQELSYALNNYANCLMMEGNFDDAISNLKRALMFNESKYAETVLNTNLMICYAIIGDTSCVQIYKKLEKFIIDNKNEQLDISIYLKVTYALGFVQEICGNDNLNELYINNKKYCNLAIEIADKYDANSLPYLWFKDWRNDIEEDILRRVSDDFKGFYMYRFEPWLLTITHD